MTLAKILSVVVFLGILLFTILTFGLTYKVVLIGALISTVLSIIYYKVLKLIDKLELKN